MKQFIIIILFKLLGVDQSLRKVYSASDLPTMETPKEDKAAMRLMIDKHKVAMADVADIEDYITYLHQLILIYQRRRLKARDKKHHDYLIIIVFLTKHINELEISLKGYEKMNKKRVFDVRKHKLKNQRR